ncbi:hypothetical protein [Streptomyces sp. NPDC057381]|uniref:hypothetical protein n=1 Tax=Streptomyces sp. NPDC057381 TaxID=3346111 RepID=UPI0036402381
MDCKPVGTDYQVEAPWRGPPEGDVHPAFILVESGDRVVEHEFGLGLRRPVEHLGQVGSGHLDRRRLVRGERELQDSPAAGVEQGQRPIAGGELAELREDAHALGDRDRGPLQPRPHSESILKER